MEQKCVSFKPALCVCMLCKSTMASEIIIVKEPTFLYATMDRTLIISKHIHLA